jgi:hypothetical protein
MITSREVHAQPQQSMPEELPYPEEDDEPESPRGEMMYNFNPAEMPMLPGGGCHPFVPMMPTALHIGNMPRGARGLDHGQHLEQNANLMSAVPQCMGWWMPGAGADPEGMVGLFTSLSSAVGAVPYFPQASMAYQSMSQAHGPM